MAATTIGRESMTDGTTVWNVSRIGSAIYDRVDTLVGAAISFGGTVGSEGFGTHTFSASGTGANTFAIRNPTAGATNQGVVNVGNDTSASALQLQALSSTFTANNNLCQVAATIAGGLRLLSSHASGEMSFFTANTRRLTITPAGLVTLATDTKMDCGFLAYNSSGDASVASTTAVDFDTEVYDEGGNFAADTFTAPTTGRYWLASSVMIQNNGGGVINSGARFVVSNHTGGFFFGYQPCDAGGAQYVFSGSVVVDMDAGDTATVQYYSDTGAADIRGDGTLRLTWFAGRRML